MDTKWSVGFDIEKSYNNYISDDLDIEALSLTLRAGRQINSFVRFQWHYRIQSSHVYYDESKNCPENNQPDPDDSPKKAARKKKRLDENNQINSDEHISHMRKNAGIVSASGVTFTYDSTDSPNCPTRGFKSVFEAELAGFGGNFSFWSFAYLNTYYYPFTDSLILKYRGDIKILTPFAGTTYNNMPLDERFFLGGNTQVRGYRPYRIGPRFGESDIPKGGITQQFFSVELDHKWSKRVDGFLFMDVGHLSEKEWNFNWTGFRGSLGFGLRLCLMDSLPPISLGMGFPINPLDDSEIKRFFIQFGCKF